MARKIGWDVSKWRIVFIEDFSRRQAVIGLSVLHFVAETTSKASFSGKRFCVGG
jgi:hypothetical protein